MGVGGAWMIFHSRTMRSMPALTIWVPSGENEADLTPPVCFSKTVTVGGDWVHVPQLYLAVIGCAEHLVTVGRERGRSNTAGMACEDDNGWW